MSNSSKIQNTIFDKAVDAIISGDSNILKKFISETPQIIHQQSSADHRASLLHYVSANGVEDDKQKTPDNIVEIAGILLGAGADPNKMSNIYGGGAGSTPLVALVSSSHPARAGKQTELIRLFCEYGNPNGLDNKQYPLATAISFRYPKAVYTLVDSGAKVDNIISASAIGNLDLIKQLSSDTLAPYTNSFGMTTSDSSDIKALALSASCMTGHLKIVDYFVKQGVDIEAKISVENTSALVETVICGHLDLADYLLRQGADITSQDHQGFTALHWAAWHGYIDLVDLLLSYDAPLEIVNKYGGTVIDTAVHGYQHSAYPASNQIETLQLLIDAGADVSKVSPYPSGNKSIDDFLKPHIREG